MIFILWSYASILLLAVVFLLAYLYSTRNFNYWKERNVFYFKPAPFFGTMLPIFSMKTTYGEWLRQKYRSVNADYFGLFSFEQPVLVVKSPRIIKHVLLKDFSSFNDRLTTNSEKNEIVSNIMFFKKNPGWKEIRVKMTPVFSSGKQKLMFPLMLNEGERMVDFIRENAVSGTAEVREICFKFSTNVIARCAFAVDARCFENHNAEFRQIGREIFNLRLSNALRQFTCRFSPRLVQLLDISFVSPKCLENLKDIFLTVLHERKKIGSFGENDLVDILLRAKEFNEAGMVAQAIQFFGAGFETTGNTLSFCLYELGINQEIQDKARQEVLDSIEENGGLTYEGMNDMKYVDMCVCETLRKYPVLPSIDRMCKADFKVPGTNLIIEKGTPVYIPLFGLHYDEKYFPEPERFDPERFADKSTINKDGFYYLPFGEGPRNCIGIRFGLSTVKVGLISTLLNFKVEKAAETPIPLEFEPKSVTLLSKVGIPLRLIPLS